MSDNPDGDPNVVKYFTERIQSKGFTDVLYESTGEGSSATARRGEESFRIITSRRDALKQLWILLKDMRPLDDW